MLRERQFQLKMYVIRLLKLIDRKLYKKPRVGANLNDADTLGDAAQAGIFTYITYQ